MANLLQFRADHIGLLVPPPEGGDIDAQVKALVAMQRAAGVSCATDGELRRSHFLDRLMAGEGPILAESEAKPLLQIANMDVKVSLPSASAVAARTGAAADACVQAVRREIAALVEAGVHYVQLNGTAYGPAIDSGEAIDAALEMDAAMLEDFAGSDDYRIALRVGRDGASPVWNASDARLERLFGLGFDRYLIDFGSDPAGFDVLRLVPDGTMVTLGLIESASAEMQSMDALLDFIDAAAEIKDGNELALSPRGGFNERSGVTWDDQKRKLAQVADICVRWWGFAR